MINIHTVTEQTATGVSSKSRQHFSESKGPRRTDRVSGMGVMEDGIDTTPILADQGPMKNIDKLLSVMEQHCRNIERRLRKLVHSLVVGK